MQGKSMMASITETTSTSSGGLTVPTTKFTDPTTYLNNDPNVYFRNEQFIPTKYPTD